MLVQMFQFVIVLSLFPIQGDPVIKDKRLLSHTLERLSLWTLQSITVPLSHHIRPHRTASPPQPSLTVSHFLLISGH